MLLFSVAVSRAPAPAPDRDVFSSRPAVFQSRLIENNCRRFFKKKFSRVLRLFFTEKQYKYIRLSSFIFHLTYYILHLSLFFGCPLVVLWLYFGCFLVLFCSILKFSRNNFFLPNVGDLFPTAILTRPRPAYHFVMVKK